MEVETCVVIGLIAMIWGVSSIASSVWLLVDLRNQPEIMSMMKVAWTLITLYLGVIGLALYVTSCREPRPGTHDEFVAPMWKQATGSVIHCVAGDALGIVGAAVVTSLLGMPMYGDMVVEYIVGFLVGWLLFQTIPMMHMNHISLQSALRTGFWAELLSLTFMVLGMFPTMVYLMSLWSVMSPWSFGFWFVMSMSILVGSVVTYPINWWMVSKGMKHGMGSAHVMGHGGSEPIHLVKHVHE
ncbi:DUF4396 domain-containing protein [Alicyclobacillus tolerans]|uniref:DUF4396 domain-containing protein n=1 Tax=Alicyclobacillus tolerans TaxID=90970 RepID=UPI001F3DE655|nr:DUF4396 domain-containing protein [Alicyclobacillus tolerans]MCF8567056.1 DUF4396 domain-containing protein [Alicyclobacillus tolerans]